MRADPTELPAPLAVHAQDLEARGETIVPQPTVDTSGSDLASVFRPIVVDVVDGEEHLLGFAAAGTHEAPVSGKHLLLDTSIYPAHPTVVVFSAGGAMVLGHQGHLATSNALTRLVSGSLPMPLPFGGLQGTGFTGLHPFTRGAATEDAQSRLPVAFLGTSGHRASWEKHQPDNDILPGEDQ